MLVGDGCILKKGRRPFGKLEASSLGSFGTRSRMSSL